MQRRSPADIEQVVSALCDWLRDPAQDSLRRAFVTWLKRVLLPARVPGARLPEITELQKLHAMLAERVKTWPAQWKAEGRKEGRKEGEGRLLRLQLEQRFGPLPAWVATRLQQATEAQLEQWGKRVLTCETLDAVFAEVS